MEWMCSRCGALHRANTPPCNECGHGQFERPYEQPEQRAADEPTTTTQWVCTECGRTQPKHSPPCSRCGGMDLEQQSVDVAPDDLAAPSYRELASPLQLAVFAVAILAAVVVGLGVLGVVDVPGTAGGPDELAPPDAPGDPVAVDGQSLAAVEESYLAAVDEERQRRDAASVTRSDDLDEIATFYNRWWVQTEYGDESVPIEDVREHVAATCELDVVLVPFQVVPAAYDSVDDPGETIAERATTQRSALATTSASQTGVDVHAAPDGRLFVTQILC